MDFQEFWKRLSTKIKHSKRFKTLRRNNSFVAGCADVCSIEIIPDSTRKSRKIPIEQFQGMRYIMKNEPRNKKYIMPIKNIVHFRILHTSVS